MGVALKAGARRARLPKNNTKGCALLRLPLASSSVLLSISRAMSDSACRPYFSHCGAAAGQGVWADDPTARVSRPDGAAE